MRHHWCRIIVSMSDTTQNTDDALSIGQLAELGGVNRRTVRYYVQRGLLEAPHRLVFVGHPDRDGGVGNVGYATLVDWRERSQSFAELAAMRGWGPSMVTAEGGAFPC